jgi:hypothetical protein
MTQGLATEDTVRPAAATQELIAERNEKSRKTRRRHRDSQQAFARSPFFAFFRFFRLHTRIRVTSALPLFSPSFVSFGYRGFRLRPKAKSGSGHRGHIAVSGRNQTLAPREEPQEGEDTDSHGLTRIGAWPRGGPAIFGRLLEIRVHPCESVSQEILAEKDKM